MEGMEAGITAGQYQAIGKGFLEEAWWGLVLKETHTGPVHPTLPCSALCGALKLPMCVFFR